MPLDLSGVDAELDALGNAPEHTVALARTLAGVEVTLDQLEAIDHELGRLEAGAPALPPGSNGAVHHVAVAHAPQRESARAIPSLEPHEPAHDEALRDAPRESGPAPAGRSIPAPPPSTVSDGMESWPPLAHSEPPEAAQDDSPLSAVHSMPPPALTQSQEIVLPDPIPREELSTESGELRLDDDKPASGSFSLDEEPPESDAFGPHAEQSEPPAPARPRLSQFVADDVGEALEGSQPLSIGNPKRGASKTPPFAFDRDPDAEFDALLSEATDPNGMPTDGSEADVDELLEGLHEDELEGDLHADLATSEFNPDASTETEAHEATEELALLMLEESEDATEVVHRAALGALHADTPVSGAPHSAAEAAIENAGPAQEDTLTELGELEMGELDIVMDEAPTKAPPPPPPRPSTSGEKRPSGFLGRFFNRGERE